MGGRWTADGAKKRARLFTWRAVLASRLLLLPCVSSYAYPKPPVKMTMGGTSACTSMSVKRSLFPRADLLRQLAMPLAAAASFRGQDRDQRPLLHRRPGNI